MATLAVRRLGYALGAEVKGLDLTKPQDDETIASIRRIWLEHHVLCFPEQDLGPHELCEFAGRFGTLDDNRGGPQHRRPETNFIAMLVNKPIEFAGKAYNGGVADLWHSDQSYTNHPSTATFLNAKELPAVGGDTMFANAYMAYETLSDAFKRLIEPLEGIHDFSLSPNAKQRGPELQAEIIRQNPPIAHPLVRTHSETGRKALYVGNRISGIAGLSDDESRPILTYLNQHQTRYEFLYRHRWTVNDLIMWDNRCTLHYAVQDYDHSQLRRLLRAGVFGERSGRLLNADPGEKRGLELSSSKAT